MYSELWDRVKHSILLDTKLQLLIQELQQQTSSHSKFTWDGTTLLRKGMPMVGNNVELRKELFNHFHAGPTRGHSSIHATRQRLLSILY